MSKYTPQFATAAQVTAICETMQTIEQVRATDRALIDNLANGGRPYSAEEQAKYQIQVNVNWMEMTKILQDAVGQINNALIYKERLFTARCKGGKVEKQKEYTETFTNNIHEPLKRGESGRKHMFLLKSRNASIALHGIGNLMWMNDYSWMPRFIPLEDLLIPTDTLCDYSNLGQFAVNLYLTQAEFFDMTHGEKVQPGWNITAVRRILDDLKDPNEQTGNNAFTFQDQPEKRIEQFKQNHCFYDSDAAKTVKLRMFFYKDPEKGTWYRCGVLREGTVSQPSDKEFIYEAKDTTFAENIARILHSQFGDNNLCAPLKYHSVRGLGVMLYAPVECNNRVRCETVQHLMLNLKTLLRISNPSDRDRPKLLELSQYSVVEDGVTFVTEQERHQVDAKLVEYVQSQMRQLMSEGSASYVQDINDGTGKERTATETNAMLQSVNVQVSTMLQSMYMQEAFYYEEVVRRMLTSTDKDAEEFRKSCKDDGIPDELMKLKNWEIDPERVMGAGDQTLAGQEADALLSQSQRFDPTAQRWILKNWAIQKTRNPALGNTLVPEDKSVASKGTIAAEDVFATLMAGIPASIREGIERNPYIESLIGMMGEKIQQITKTDNMGTPQEVIGLKTVADHIGKNIQIIAADEEQKQNVKLYSDELGKLMNLVKGFEQRQQQAMQKQQEAQSPEAQAKAQALIMQTEAKLQAKEAEFNQKMAHREQQFEQRITQESQKHDLAMKKMLDDMRNEMIANGMKVGQEMAHDKLRTEQELASKAKAETKTATTQ